MNCPIVNELIYKGSTFIFKGVYNNKDVAIKYLLDDYGDINTDWIREAKISQLASKYVNTPLVHFYAEFMDRKTIISINQIMYDPSPMIIFTIITGLTLQF